MAESGPAPTSIAIPCPVASCPGPGVAVGPGPEAADIVEHPIQADAFDALHRVVADALLLAIVEHRHDVGVVQLRRRAGLGLKSPQVGPVGAEPRVHDLERHAALERLVLGFVDDAHAAAAELAEEGVVSQPPRAVSAAGVRAVAAGALPTGRRHPPARA